MIGALPCECPNNCSEKTTLGNLEDHIKKCPKRAFICNGQGEECKFEGIKDDFLKHIVETHQKKILALYDNSMAMEQGTK